MDRGLVPPSLEAGLLEWMHKKATWMSKNPERRGIIQMEYHQFLEKAAREVFDDRRVRVIPLVQETIKHLIDAGDIERVDVGNGGTYFRVTQASRGDNPRIDCGAAARGDTLSRSDGVEPKRAMSARAKPEQTSEDTEVTPTVVFPVGVSQRSARTPTPFTYLARDFFPRLMRDHGHTAFTSWTDVPAFSRNIRQWHEQDGIEYSQIRVMMEEFARHPEWCRRSRNMPWKVFLSRRDQIAGLVSTQMRRDPSNRQLGPQTKDEWFSRRTSRTYSPA